MNDMRVLIVFAHPERDSFNGFLLDQALSALAAAGHEVEVSDLWRQGFDPVSGRGNFAGEAVPGRLDLQNEEARASAESGFVPTLQAEMDAVARCDLLVLQFPIGWLGPPAILKGWIDRVFAVGRAYGGGRSFDEGYFAGKRAFCVVTTGGPASVYSHDGAYAPIGELLFPLHRGTFGFTGFTVLEPLAFYGPKRWMIEVERLEAGRRYVARLADLDSAPVIPQPTNAELRRLLAETSDGITIVGSTRF